MATMTAARQAEIRLKLGYSDGDAVFVSEREGDFVFKRPTKHVWGQFWAAMNGDGKKKAEKDVAFEQLCVGCLVYPEAAEGQPDYGKLMAMFERLPGLPMSVGGELCDLAGLGDGRVGKL